jgi:spermidine synthase
MASAALRARVVFVLASLCFFASGMTGLAYQVIWFKRFAHAWGSSALAMGSVVASFLFGLGLGAWLLGRIADRVRRPLLWYGVFELGIGALAALIPFEIQALVRAAAVIHPVLPEQPVALFLARAIVTLLILGPPCALMGGTLPLLIRQFTPPDAALSHSTGWFYGINTLGAAFGCYLAGFHLLPMFGLFWTNNVAALLNGVIGVLSVAISLAIPRRLAQAPSAAVAPTPQPASAVLSAAEVVKRPHWGWRLSLAVLLTGCGALVLEMAWTRQLVLLLGGSTYAFTSTVLVVLVGIALGSLIFHVALRRVATRTWPIAVVIPVLAGSTIVGKELLPTLTVQSGELRDMRQTTWGNALYCVGTSAILELLPALAMGVLFPLIVAQTRETAATAGHAVGSVYAWNTLGALIGSIATSAMLIPWLHASGSIALALGFYFVALLALLPWHGPRDWGLAAVCLAAGVGCVAVALRPGDVLLANLGVYLYGNESVDKENHRLLEYREGLTCNVLMTETSGYRVLRVNGKVDADDGPDMMNFLGIAYFSRCFCPDAKDVLVVGYGSGATVGAALAFPDTQVTCCEIEPAVYDASHWFARANHEPSENPHFRVVLDDGRSFLQGSRQHWDLIVTQPSNPWMAGVSNLFTREYFELAKSRLTDDGVLAQWIQTYDLTGQDYAMLLRTLLEVFPHAALIALSEGNDTIVMASMRPLAPTAEDLARVQRSIDASPELTADLEYWFGTRDLRHLLVHHYTLGEPELRGIVARDDRLRERAGEVPPRNTDLNLRLEFDAPLRLFVKNGSPAAYETSAVAWIRKAYKGQTVRQLGLSLGVDPTTADYAFQIGQMYMRLAEDRPGYLRDAIRNFDQAALRNPRDFEIRRQLALALEQHGDWEDASKVWQRVLERAPNDAAALCGLGRCARQQGVTSRAIEYFQKALDEFPGYSKAAEQLARLLATHPDAAHRNGAKAVELAELACQRVQFAEAPYLDTLAAAYAEVGQFDKAVSTARKSVELARAERKNLLAREVESRLKLYEAGQPYRDKPT